MLIVTFLVYKVSLLVDLLYVNALSYPPKSLSIGDHDHNPSDSNCSEQDLFYNNLDDNFLHL